MAFSVQPRLDISRSIYLTRLLDDIDATSESMDGCSYINSDKITKDVRIIALTTVTSIREDVATIQQRCKKFKGLKIFVPVKISLRTSIAEFVFRSYQLTQCETAIRSKQICRYFDHAQDMKVLSGAINKLVQANISVISKDLVSMRARWVELDAQFKEKCIRPLSKQAEECGKQWMPMKPWDVFKNDAIAKSCLELSEGLKAIGRSRIPINMQTLFSDTEKLVHSLNKEREKQIDVVNRAIEVSAKCSAELARQQAPGQDISEMRTQEVMWLYGILSSLEDERDLDILNALQKFQIPFTFQSGDAMTIPQRILRYKKKKDFDADSFGKVVDKVCCECAMLDFQAIAKEQSVEKAEQRYGTLFKKLGIIYSKAESGKIECHVVEL